MVSERSSLTQAPRPGFPKLYAPPPAPIPAEPPPDDAYIPVGYSPVDLGGSAAVVASCGQNKNPRGARFGHLDTV